MRKLLSAIACVIIGCLPAAGLSPCTPELGFPDGGGCQLVVNHGGEVIAHPRTYAVFWGDWGAQQDTAEGLDTLLAGLGGSRYLSAVDEYSGGSSGEVRYMGKVVDASSPPSADGGMSTAQVGSEMCKVTGDRPDPEGVYVVYSAEPSTDGRVCGWHIGWQCREGNATVVYVPYPGNESCLARGWFPEPYHEDHLVGMANITAHELAESITDPGLDAWFSDPIGSGEIGDKCAWQFYSPVTLTNGSTWWLQALWSNRAARVQGGQGGYRGCIQEGGG